MDPAAPGEDPARLAEAKARLHHEVDRRADLLIEVSQRIHAQPELAFQERYAHELLTEVLAAEGLATTRSAYGLETAFDARAGSSGPLVAVLCEYDALPGLGHACGHNVIAAAGLGAGLAAAALAEELGGRVVVLGSPAEEGGGGKVFMAREGAFEGVEAAMMVHPADADLASMDAIAVQPCSVEYHGVAAHAAAFPHLGRNALDAAVLGYVNVAALRQHLRSDQRVHGILLESGERPNVVPAHASAEWYVRAADLEQLVPLKERVEACLGAGATAAGCQMELRWHDPAYADLVGNDVLGALYGANSADLGRPVEQPSADHRVVGSTDMGNVSHLVPSIHPMIRVAPPGVGIHTPDFAAHAASPAGDRAVLDGAKAMAATIADLWLRPAALGQVRSFRAPTRA
jgi:amidohydrolase